MDEAKGNALIGFTHPHDKLLFTVKKASPKRSCHCEPVRTLVWQSPNNSGRFVRAFVRFSYIFPLSGGLPRRCAPRNDSVFLVR